MIQQIKNCKELSPYLKENIEDEGLLELKNVNSPKRLIIKDIHEKFEMTIKDFLDKRFGVIFLSDRYKYKNIKLYLVSDAYGLKGKYNSFEEYERIQNVKQDIRRRDSLRIDFTLSNKPFRIKGKVVTIKYDIPPNPIIMKNL